MTIENILNEIEKDYLFNEKINFRLIRQSLESYAKEKVIEELEIVLNSKWLYNPKTLEKEIRARIAELKGESR